MPNKVRSTRVGVEHELLAFDASTGGAVAIARVRRAVAGTPLADGIAFEPGGQVELNLPCAPGAPELARSSWPVSGSCGGAARTPGCASRRSRSTRARSTDLPLQLPVAALPGDAGHFDRIGPAGRRMMRQTAGTQVCLDWWPGRAGLEQWRLLLLAGPFLAAALNRSIGPDSRLATWLAVDPDRTGFDDRLLRGDDPVAAYA